MLQEIIQAHLLERWAELKERNMRGRAYRRHQRRRVIRKRFKQILNNEWWGIDRGDWHWYKDPKVIGSLADCSFYTRCSCGLCRSEPYPRKAKHVLRNEYEGYE